MIIRDITHDTATRYHLATNEQVIFFLANRSDELTFTLTEPGAAAYICALFVGKQDDTHQLRLIQKHRSPHTTSQAIVRSVLSDTASMDYRGTIHIAKTAPHSDASQESRALLLSPEARAFSEPALEIENDQVHCHHAATLSSLSEDPLAYLRTRGLSEAQAQHLLAQGFLTSLSEPLAPLLSSQEKEKMLALITSAISSTL